MTPTETQSNPNDGPCPSCGSTILLGRMAHHRTWCKPSAAQAAAALAALAPFIGRNQRRTLAQLASHSEERDWFRKKIVSLAQAVATMPKTYETDGQGMRAVAHLRYFAGGSAACHITERDIDHDGEGQVQAFGHADLFGDGGELGYISIAEWLENGAEIDLYFNPCPLWQALGRPEPVAEVDEDAIAAVEEAAQ